MMKKNKLSNSRKRKLIYVTVIIFLCVLSLMPYPTRVLSHIKLTVINETDKPLVGFEGAVQFTLYPTLEEENLKFVLDNNGSANLNEQVLWLCWIKRRFYDLLSVVSHDGWGKPSGTILITMPNKTITPGNLLVAELNNPKMEIKDWSYAPEDKRAEIGYGNKEHRQFWSLKTESSTPSDDIKLYINDLREDICSDIVLKVNIKKIDKYSSSSGL